MSIKYYATEEYVDAALTESDSSKIFKIAEANQQLATDDSGEIHWEDKPIYKTNRTVHKIHSDNVRDLGEVDGHGRYQYTVRLNAVGHINPAPWNTVAYPLTVIFDGESYTITNKRLPVVVSNPTSKITVIHMYQHGNDAGVDIQFDEPGEHTIIYENGEMRYSHIGYEYLPEGYPKIEKQYKDTKSYIAPGTLSSDENTYFYIASNCVLEPESLYSVTVNSTEYFINSETDDAGKIIVGNNTVPYADPPVCLIYDPSTSKTTFYWNESDGQNLSISISKIEDVLTPMDEKFLPEHNHAVSWNNLEDKPFGTKIETVEIVPETTLTVGGTSPFPTLATGVEYFIEGKEYIVSVNGIQYRCVGGRRQDDRSRELAILGTRTPDVPFEIYVFMTEGHSTFGSLDHQAQFWPLEDGDYTIAIYEEQEVVKPLDVEFLPEHTHSIEQGGTGQTSIVDTTYTEPRYRASALVSTETTPTSNGVITWIYE